MKIQYNSLAFLGAHGAATSSMAVLTPPTALRTNAVSCENYFDTLFLRQLMPLNCVCHIEALFSWPFCMALSDCELLGAAASYAAVLPAASWTLASRHCGLAETPNQRLRLLEDVDLPRKVAASFLAAPSRLLEPSCGVAFGVASRAPA